MLLLAITPCVRRDMCLSTPFHLQIVRWHLVTDYIYVADCVALLTPPFERYSDAIEFARTLEFKQSLPFIENAAAGTLYTHARISDIYDPLITAGMPRYCNQLALKSLFDLIAGKVDDSCKIWC